MKQLKLGFGGLGVLVAPHAGAWIETYKKVPHPSYLLSPPTRGRGLKLVSKEKAVLDLGRPPRGGVD